MSLITRSRYLGSEGTVSIELVSGSSLVSLGRSEGYSLRRSRRAYVLSRDWADIL